VKAEKHIERAVRKLVLPGTKADDERILDDALAAFRRSRSSQSNAIETNIWRLIMESKITKLVTAAVILVAAGLAIHFSGGSVDLTTIAMGDITEAMQKQPWLHCISRSSHGGTSQNIEAWVNFEAKIAGFKMDPGKTQFWDIMDEKKYEFDSETNTITVEYTDDKYLPAQMSSPAAAVETMYEVLRNQGAEITTKVGEYEGQAVQIQEMILSSESGPSQTLALYIEPQSKLILAADVKVTDPNGQVMASAEMTYSYPQSGPRSIYDLGVPRDAEIISKLPSEDYSSIWEKYRQSRKDATEEYIAIVTSAERFPSDAITRVEVDYKSGPRQRMEHHSVFKPGEPFEEFWPQYKEQLGNTFDSLLEWAAKNYEQEKGILSVFINDGQYSRHARRRGSGEWKLYKRAIHQEVWICLLEVSVGLVGRRSVRMGLL